MFETWIDEKIVEVKKEINNLLWEYGPPSLTLEEADLRSCSILNIIRRKPEE